MKIQDLILCVFLIGTCFSCTKEVIEEVPPMEEEPPLDQEIKYDPDVLNILNASCIGCHGETDPKGGLDLSSYDKAREATENGALIQLINDEANPMPPSGLLSSSKIQIIEEWVSDGFVEK